MQIQVSWELVTLIIAVLGHAFATVKWGTTISDNIKTLNDSMIRIDKELEKRDIQISAIWKRLDEVRDLIDKK